MSESSTCGSVVILNGVPRSGKTSIARALMADGSGTWVNHGVDAVMAATPADLRPGVGLRPGGERPDLEVHLPRMFEEMYAEVARLARAGYNVAVDVGHHDGYSTPLGMLDRVGEWLAGIEVLLVGVRCDLDEVVQRRAQSGDAYLSRAADGSVAEPVVRWQSAVHDPGDYDLEVDTTQRSAAECAAVILRKLAGGRGGSETSA